MRGERIVVLDGLSFFGGKLAFGGHFLINETAEYGTLGIGQILWVSYPASKVCEARSILRLVEPDWWYCSSFVLHYKEDSLGWAKPLLTTWEAGTANKLEYEAKILMIGAFLDRTIFRYILNRDMTRLVAEFKYYVENGVGASSKSELALNEVA